MMLKRMLISAALFLGLITGSVSAQELTKKLPAPALDGGIPLMEAIHNRRSTREFSSRKIDDQTLSEILYVAWGISHDGKHTIPTSMNKQNLNVYVIMPDGAWLYEPGEHQLKQESSADLRAFFNQQDYMNDAQLTLLYTGSDGKNSPLHAGSAYQNVSLYTTSRGLNNVVRGYFDRAGIAKALGIEEDNAIISQTIGWPYLR